jgi:hypothetical protein
MEKHLTGKVTPPADMMEAARKSLEPYPDAFEDPMAQTGNQPPTPDQLCLMVDRLRQSHQ